MNSRGRREARDSERSSVALQEATDEELVAEFEARRLHDQLRAPRLRSAQSQNDVHGANGREASPRPQAEGIVGRSSALFGLRTPTRQNSAPTAAVFTAPPRLEVLGVGPDPGPKTPTPLHASGGRDANGGDRNHLWVPTGHAGSPSVGIKASPLPELDERGRSVPGLAPRLLGLGRGDPHDDPGPEPVDDEDWTEEGFSGEHPQQKQGMEAMAARQLGHWGNVVAHFPWSTVVLTVLLHVALACGMLRAQFSSDSHLLYVGQRTPIAAERRHSDEWFGDQPSPFFVILQPTDPDVDVLTREWMRQLFELHNTLYHLEVPLPPSQNTYGALDGEPVPTNVSYADICARRYVHMRGQDECIILSPLQLWLYSEEMLESDKNVAKTLSGGYRDHMIDLGGAHLDVRGTGPVHGAHALSLIYYLDVNDDAFWDDRGLTWDEGARKLVDELDARYDNVTFSYWSRHFNEEESSRFVQRDSGLIGASFLVVLVYVSLTLSGWGCNPQRSRYLLGTCALVCSGLALVSGFGLASLLQIPLTPISPLVCFTLLGVSVDDMIIITDAFDRLSAAKPHVRPGGGMVGGALYEIGGAISMTSLTTIATFLTGWSCDLPVYSYFCGSASACVLMLFQVQMTLYAALLVVDARRRHRLRFPERPRDPGPRSGGMVLSCIPPWWRPPPPPPRKKRNSLTTVVTAPGIEDHYFEDFDGELGHGHGRRNGYGSGHNTPGSPPTPSPMERTVRGGPGASIGRRRPRWSMDKPQPGEPAAMGIIIFIQKLVLKRRTRYLSLFIYGALVMAALFAAPSVNVGLPQRQTVSDDSEIAAFLDDLDNNWRGDMPTTVQLVFRDTDLRDQDSVDRVQRVIDGALELPFVMRTQVDWIERFGQWCACVRGAKGNVSALPRVLPPPPECSVAEFLADGTVVEECGDVPDGRHGKQCEDLDDAFKAMNGGHSCEAAKSHCGKGKMGWRTVQKYCPVTCEVCMPKSEAGHRVDGVAANVTAAELAPERRAVVDVEVPLSAMGGKDLAADVRLARPGDCASPEAPCVAAAHRVLLIVLLPQIYFDAYDDWLAIHELFLREGADGYVYHIKYEFAISDFNMLSISVRNLITATPVIGICVCLFLHPKIALMAVAGVVSIDVLLFGLMAATGVPLNVITLISLLIALGLAIDYSCHLGHAYQHADYPSREKKVSVALKTVGISILNAGGSTLVGTSLIAASKSALFRIFFMFVWGTIALGLLAGLFIVPSALASFGPVMRPASIFASISVDSLPSFRAVKDEGDTNGGGGGQPPAARGSKGKLQGMREVGTVTDIHGLQSTSGAQPSNLPRSARNVPVTPPGEKAQARLVGDIRMI